MADYTNYVKISAKGYDQEALDNIIKKFVDILKNEGIKISGPIPMPTKVEIYTILRSPHKHKDSREQFERRIHKRIITAELSQKALNTLNSVKLPSSVVVDLTLQTNSKSK